MPKDIAPKIFEMCKKKWTVHQALLGDVWIQKINLEAFFTL
jgi:hypothetical protein